MEPLKVKFVDLACPRGASTALRASVGPADLLRVCAGVHALHNALPEDPVELLVEGRRGSDEVVREVGPAKIAQVERSELPA